MTAYMRFVLSLCILGALTLPVAQADAAPSETSEQVTITDVKVRMSDHGPIVLQAAQANASWDSGVLLQLANVEAGDAEPPRPGPSTPPLQAIRTASSAVPRTSSINWGLFQVFCMALLSLRTADV